MTNPPVTAEIHKPLDIHGDFPTAITFNAVIVLNDVPDPSHLFGAEIITVHLIR
jgi:hypothetical protein